MLHHDFNWGSRPEITSTIWLYFRARAVASVGERLDGRWVATVNRHRDASPWPSAFSNTKATGVRWVERWAYANLERLKREVPQPKPSVWGVG